MKVQEEAMEVQEEYVYESLLCYSETLGKLVVVPYK